MLELRAGRLAYGSIVAVHDVDIAVPRGTVVALLGRNGAGKSTMLRGLAGAHRLHSGRRLVDGEDLTELRAGELVRRGVSLVPEGRRIFPSLTVAENLIAGATGRRLTRAELRDEVEEVFELFPHLGSRRNQLAGRLSGGEQQMTAIARALMARPGFLLIDEPSLGLAPVAIDALYVLLASLRGKAMGMLLVEQYVDRAIDLADIGIVLSSGRVALRGPAKDLPAAAIEAAYLGKVA